MSERRYFSGDTESQAVLEAAGLFGIEPRELAYRLVDKKHGFLRQRRRVVIVVDPAAPRRSGEEAVDAPEALQPTAACDAEAPEAAPPRAESAPAGSPDGAPVRPPAEAPAGTATQVATADARAEVVAALELVLRLGALEVEWRLEGDEGEWRVELSGEDAEWLVEDDGKLLSAVEHLAGRVLWHRRVEPVALRLDSQDFRRRREAALEQRARAAAQRVRASGQAEALEEMEPAERRLVHLTIEDEAGVTTQSIGGGWRKRVEIRPA